MNCRDEPDPFGPTPHRVFMTGPLSEVPLTHQKPAADRSGRVRGHGDLKEWLVARSPALVSIWTDELPVGADGAKRRLLERMAELIVRMLPLMMGPRTDHVAPVWDRTAALFGAFAEKRGLAAGEAIEELHGLREIVVRELYRDPPRVNGHGEPTVSLREILRLNRALDRAVAHASVGHTDALFFEFFGRDAGSPLLPSDDPVSAMREEVTKLVAEVGGMLDPSVQGGARRSEH